MSKADVEYKKLVEKIINEGYSNEGEQVRTVWADGTPAYTKSIIEHTMVFEPDEFPILTTKRVAWKTALREILWIWQQKSNNINDLKGNIWNEWADKEGLIGKAYGYQMGKKVRCLDGKMLDQVDYLIYNLKNNPASRRHVTSLWNIDDLDDMNLEPCVWSSQFFVQGDVLHLTVRARSNDISLGNPFNVLQYAILHRMIAQVTNYKLGKFTYSIGDAHIYDRHIEPLREQINRETFDAPTLWINPQIKDFYDFTINDFKLISYKHGEKIKMEVAI